MLRGVDHIRYERALAITERRDKLIELIRSGELSSTGLAQKLGASEQTIYRDVDFLKKRGYSIRSEKHSDGWAYHLFAEPARVSE